MSSPIFPRKHLLGILHFFDQSLKERNKSLVLFFHFFLTLELVVRVVLEERALIANEFLACPTEDVFLLVMLETGAEGTNLVFRQIRLYLLKSPLERVARVVSLEGLPNHFLG